MQRTLRLFGFELGPASPLIWVFALRNVEFKRSGIICRNQRVLFAGFWRAVIANDPLDEFKTYLCPTSPWMPKIGSRLERCQIHIN